MPAGRDEQGDGEYAKRLASLMSSVQGLEGEGSQCRSVGSSRCCGLAVADIQWQPPGTALGTILWSLLHPPWAPVNPTEAVIQPLAVVCSKHPCSCHARLAAHFSGEGQRLIPGSLSASLLHLPHSQSEMCPVWRYGQHLEL